MECSEIKSVFNHHFIYKVKLSYKSIVFIVLQRTERKI
jgi:hypothetical protein